MPSRKSVVRNLSIGVTAIVTLVIAAVGLVNNILSHHYALESAREVLKFNSESILGGIDTLMMTRNNDGVLELIQDISKDSTVYRDIRLMSHYSGEIVVSNAEKPQVDEQLLNRRVAYAFSNTQRRTVYTGRARLQGRERVGKTQAPVAVTVPVDADGVAHA